MKKLHIAEISVSFGLVIAIIISVVGFEFKCNDIRDDVVRLHILANSDTDEDQKIKIMVRDALLSCGKEIFSGDATVKNAEYWLNSQKTELTDIANKVLADNGFDYQTQIYLAEEYFSTRTYENFTLPAGEYLALKVILGKGEGHNWWCVMFPPLCLPAASENTELDVVFGVDGADIVTNSSKYEIRFKIIEIIEGIKSKLIG